MIVQLSFVLGLACVTVLIHALGTLEAIAFFSRVWERKKAETRRLVLQLQIVRVVAILLLLHLLEASVWAAFYWGAELLPDFETAIYFSMTSYTTLGYGDVVLPPPWRICGPIEGALGILMFGWSTAIMVAAINKIHGEASRIQDSPEKPS